MINILFLLIKTIGTQKEFQTAELTAITLQYGEMGTTYYAH
jgi:hypothetical protein